MTSKEMIAEWLNKNSPTQCDDGTEKTALIFRDTILQDANGRILGRTETARVKQRRLKALKTILKR